MSWPRIGIAAIQIGEFQHALTLTASRLFVNYIVGCPGEVRSFDLNGRAQSKLPFSDVAAFDGLTALPQGDVLIGVSTYLKPYRFVRWRAVDQRIEATKLATTGSAKFDDFAAAAQAVVEQKYTSADRLALRGGSNGGLLMGALITQHPQLARAVVSSVGIYDMLRVELDPNGQFNVTEFGTVKNKEQFAAMYAYSPYHHVVNGTRYPAILMTTGANDGRVNPMQSRKFAAALQAATASQRPILLRISTTSGHGIGTSLSDRIDESTDWIGFLFDQLGMKLPKY